MCAKGDHKNENWFLKNNMKNGKSMLNTEIVYNKIQLLKYYIHEREAWTKSVYD